MPYFDHKPGLCLPAFVSIYVPLVSRFIIHKKTSFINRLVKEGQKNYCTRKSVLFFFVPCQEKIKEVFKTPPVNNQRVKTDTRTVCLQGTKQQIKMVNVF